MKSLQVIILRLRLQNWLTTGLWIGVLYLVISYLLVMIWMLILASLPPYTGAMSVNYLPLSFGSVVPVYIAAFLYGTVMFIRDMWAVRKYDQDVLQQAFEENPEMWRFAKNGLIISRDNIFLVQKHLCIISITDINGIILDHDTSFTFAILGLNLPKHMPRTRIRTRDKKYYDIGRLRPFTPWVDQEQDEILQYLRNRCPQAEYSISN